MRLRVSAMRLPVALVVLFCLPAGAAGALELGEARHLAARAGFGLDRAGWEALRPLGRGEAVDRLLAGRVTEAVTPPPAWTAGPRDPGYVNTGKLPAEERAAFDERRKAEKQELKAWWAAELLATPSPLTERMVLFWHGHFTSGFNQVNQPDLMHRQNAMLRRLALGNFRDLLHAVARDPAMLVYLDGNQNKKGAPNENFARELLELFTLGEGNYTEQDVKEAARAFTGWGVEAAGGTFVQRPRLHDTDPKTVLGVTGDLDGDAVVELLLARPRTAVFVVEKLWRELVSPDPDPAEATRLAHDFRQDWDIARLVRGLLTCDAFWAPANRGVLVKSPADLVVGTVRALGLRSDGDQTAKQLQRLDLELFNPPNVRGWPGGVSWINAHTLLQRRQVTGALVRGVRMDGQDSPFAGLAEGEMTPFLLALAPVETPAAGLAPRALLDRLVEDPAYQMK